LNIGRINAELKRAGCRQLIRFVSVPFSVLIFDCLRNFAGQAYDLSLR
jgi:hypothetical protein